MALAWCTQSSGAPLLPPWEIQPGRVAGGTGHPRAVKRHPGYEAGLQPKISDILRILCLGLMFMWLITSVQTSPCKAAKGSVDPRSFLV